MSSAQRFQESFALPERCGNSPASSARHQSLLTLPPSIWCAEVAAPHRKPSGKRITSRFQHSCNELEMRTFFCQRAIRGIKRPTCMPRTLDRLPRLGRPPATMGLLPVLAAIFAFNLGSAAWSAVVAGRLTQDGAGTALLGALYAVCEISRLPAALLLPAFTLNFGARRVTQSGLLILLALPLIALSGLGNGQVM